MSYSIKKLTNKHWEKKIFLFFPYLAGKKGKLHTSTSTRVSN